MTTALCEITTHAGVSHYEHYLQQLRDWSINFPQNRHEFQGLLREVCALYGGGDTYEPDEDQEPMVFVEIGTRDGGSLYMIGAHLPMYSTIVSIDLEGAAWGRNGSYANRARIAQQLQAGWHHTVHLLDANSQLEETKEKLHELLNGRLIDVLFIDGDHKYSGVKRDWELYSPLVRDGGIVAFHDLVKPDNPRGQLIGVPELWREIKNEYRHAEFIKSEGCFGIGVLWKGIAVAEQ